MAEDRNPHTVLNAADAKAWLTKISEEGNLPTEFLDDNIRGLELGYIEIHRYENGECALWVTDKGAEYMAGQMNLLSQQAANPEALAESVREEAMQVGAVIKVAVDRAEAVSIVSTPEEQREALDLIDRAIEMSKGLLAKKVLPEEPAMELMRTIGHLEELREQGSS